MFTGRRFDIETGLYYYRARCYNPHIGRFMQTDPVGYSAGINWYTYCGNNPTNFLDPFGAVSFSMSEIEEGDGAGILIRFTVYDDEDNELKHYDACGVSDGVAWLTGLDDIFTDEWLSGQIGWKLSGKDELTFWHLQATNKLGGEFDYAKLEEYGVIISRKEQLSQLGVRYLHRDKEITWSTNITWHPTGETPPTWFAMRDVSIRALSHELQHSWDDISGANLDIYSHATYSHKNAIRTDNITTMWLINFLAPKAYGNPEDYLVSGGFSIAEAAPKPPWGIAF